MEFQEIDAKGIIKIERCTTATFPTTAYYEGRLVFNIDTDKMYYGTGVAWIEVNDASSLAAHIAATSAHGASGNIVGATTLNGAITTHAASTNHPLATTSAKGFLKQLSNDANQYMNGQGNWTNVTIPDGDGSKRTITQSSHGFSVGNLLYLDGTVYKKAIATSAVTAEVVGMISIVNSVDQFVLTTSGYVSGGIGALTAGQVYFLSDTTSGAMTPTEPTTDGYVSKPIFIACSTTEGYLINWRGIIVSTGTSSSLPIGTVITWPLESPPAGYLICNGQWCEKASYPELYGAISTLYGESGLYFAIPNYSGYFLRCWDHLGSGTDPDAAARIAPLVTGSTMLNGNHVGTIQSDAFKAHQHYVHYTANSAGSSGFAGDGTWDNPLYTTGNSIPAGGLETRPRNIYVNYCIKYQ